MLACELASFATDANRCEIEAIIRATNAFALGALCASPRITRGLTESAADVRFTVSDVSLC